MTDKADWWPFWKWWDLPEEELPQDPLWKAWDKKIGPIAVIAVLVLLASSSRK